MTETFMDASMPVPALALDLAKALASSLDATPSEFQKRLIADLECVNATSGSQQPATLPTPMQAHLESLCQTMPQGPVGDVISPLIMDLNWYFIYQSATAWPSLSSGMAAGQLIGKSGLWKSDDLLAGAMLMAPDLHYPLHQHSALELYFVLSGTVTVQHGRRATPRQLGPGDWSITPPHQVHALQSGDQGCLICYLWTEEISDENWWWEQRSDGRWDRVRWRRLADSSWRESHRELLTRAQADQAGDV